MLASARFVLLCTLYSVLCTFFLAACDDLAGTPPTPTATLTGPTLEPSATFRAQYPRNDAPEEYIGISDPTAAALAPGAAMPPLGLPGSAAEGDRQTVEVTAEDGTLL
ncbi:MAG: hypothetical protein K8I30_08325, partial [Anaerolineae bacterium]|nr:hypothetical protein [Anaerolineae bacterium]